MIRTVSPFPIGRTVATPGALAALAKASQAPAGDDDFSIIAIYLDRHCRGDWGTVDPEDWKANDVALVEGTRLLSAYELPDKTKIWIITEADRSVTTVLLPDEY